MLNPPPLQICLLKRRKHHLREIKEKQFKYYKTMSFVAVNKTCFFCNKPIMQSTIAESKCDACKSCAYCGCLACSSCFQQHMTVQKTKHESSDHDYGGHFWYTDTVACEQCHFMGLKEKDIKLFRFLTERIEKVKQKNRALL